MINRRDLLKSSIALAVAPKVLAMAPAPNPVFESFIGMDFGSSDYSVMTTYFMHDGIIYATGCNHSGQIGLGSDYS